MSVNATLLTFKSWLESQFSPLSDYPIWLHSPPWPYGSGDAQTYPYLIILPRTQHLFRYSDEEVYYSGLYRLVYVDIVGGTYNSIAGLLEAAGDWFEILRDTIQDRNYPNNRRLNDQSIDYIGEDGDGPGFTVAWDEKQSFLSTDNTPIMAIPCDVWVRESMTLG